MIDNQVYVLMYKLQSKLSTSDILIDIVRMRNGEPEFISPDIHYTPTSEYVTMLAYHLVDSWETFNV